MKITDEGVATLIFYQRNRKDRNDSDLMIADVIESLQRENAALQREAEFWFNTYRDLQLIRYGDDFVKQHMAELEAELKQEER